ncbi:carbon starvation CstA family protein [Megalodesulfovibrio gigas]|uniref:Putative carbon starvation protein CstA n=1 Tax=Megalodesulfovibrio gigas (strain ATCC 19364 / DSM 1382 / NCIMB 9332 / VKM B-1759) TaxID=1121448 RepID=T2GAS4_MEGG1|nr:carbon starvation protein A [Megalodesulfovibrio gigas]AGW13012.1 putative carbon starvation protein CstA [Megalodesulfovibrio gigas DSM 1382 = ATCC 19364]
MPSVMYFFLSVAVLIGGYAIYSRVIERMFGADNCKDTPACTMADGVDFVKMKPWKIFMIQLLNIAGLGPVFGPILGALYGPWALVWIVLGSIFAGGVHDYFSGMLSVRHEGKSIPDVVGANLGNGFKHFMRYFSVILLLLVGVVFVTGPAKLLASMTGIDLLTLVLIIFAYYFMATILPVDKIIGRIYPLFAVILIVMAVGLTGAMIVGGYEFYPSAHFANQHPTGLPLWPLMFITIACGAISGFHATQSPMMARCVPNENCGRPVFYGAMIAEGIIALIWATLGMSFYQTPEALNAALTAGGPGKVVNDVSITLMGPVGGILAILGVVVLPITSGDTAFRSARLTIADVFGYSQKANINRLIIAVPLFVVGAALSQVNFDIIWRYFGWANQTLATVVLWAAAAYLVRRGMIHWLATLPATFMTCVTVTYLCFAKIGFNLPMDISTGVGIAVAVGSLALFLTQRKQFAAQPV